MSTKKSAKRILDSSKWLSENALEVTKDEFIDILPKIFFFYIPNVGDKETLSQLLSRKTPFDTIDNEFKLSLSDEDLYVGIITSMENIISISHPNFIVRENDDLQWMLLDFQLFEIYEEEHSLKYSYRTIPFSITYGWKAIDSERYKIGNWLKNIGIQENVMEE